MPNRPPGLESFDEGTRLRALRGALDDPRFVLTGIGALLVSESNKAFREERMGNVRWKSRAETKMVPNWPGVLQDLTHGSKPKDRRFQSRPVLSDTGMLRRTVASRVVSHDTVEAGTTLPYAAALHSGGESLSPLISKAVQEKLWAWIKGRAKGAKRSSASTKTLVQNGFAQALRWLLNPHLTGTRKTIKHPVRPIVGLPKQLVEDIEGLYGQEIAKRG